MPERSEVKIPKSEETRERILNAALALFHERGFEAATMRDIAAAAGLATGAAYYYFPSKDSIVLAFYARAAKEMAPQVEEALAGARSLHDRLAGVLAVKFRYFGPSRGLLTALAVHVDPEHRLSPFSEETREIREQDIGAFERALSGGTKPIPKDLAPVLPRLLWLYQMGLILYWIHDRSPDRRKTTALVEVSLRLVVRLIRLSSLPLMRPLRRQVLELCEVALQ